MPENCETCPDEIIPPPEACPPASVMIDGDVNVDISTEDINELVDKICDCIETQTTDLCTCITAAANLIVDAINNQPPPPVVVPLACQPCIAVNGTVDGQAMIVIIDGAPTYYNADGLLDPATVEVLDACDPRCTACDCGEIVEDCCDCDCTETQLADLVTMYVDAVGA